MKMAEMQIFLVKSLFQQNSGWFMPKHFISALIGSYGTKVIMQSAIGPEISGMISALRKTNEI